MSPSLTDYPVRNSRYINAGGVSPASNNPVLDEIDQAHSVLSPPAKKALSILAPQRPDDGLNPGMASAVAPLVRPATPAVAEPATTPQPSPIAAARTPHQEELARLTTGETGKSGISQVHNPFLRTLGHVGEIALSAFSPRIASLVPGTQLHHQGLVHQAQQAVTSDEDIADNATKRHLQEAQATEQESLPEFHQAQAENNALKIGNTREIADAKQQLGESEADRKRGEGQARVDASLRQHGFKRDEKGAIVPLGYDEMSEEQQGIHDLKASQGELAEARVALVKAQKENIPVAQELARRRIDNAQQNHDVAMQRLGLSERTFDARYGGGDASTAKPGQMLADDGRVVGTAFQQNVRPTGTQRNKGDLANSAAEQVGDIKEIVKKRPDIFGPAAGRKTDFTVWLGSQDPDAQRFRAARTIASDHLAGVFGGRSETALQALDDAIGHFKDNPAAIQAGLDQVLRGNSVFQKSGTPRTAGSNAAKGNAPTPPTIATQADFDKLPKGAVYIEDGKQYRKP